MEKMKSIVHISDLHFGRPFIQDAGTAVLQFLEKTPHEALICSGDIVQFAENRSEWKAAQEFFSQISSPKVIVPGNHDVLRFFPVVRWLTPMGRYFKYIHPSRDMKLHLPGLDIVGLVVPLAILRLLFAGHARWRAREPTIDVHDSDRHPVSSRALAQHVAARRCARA